MSKNNEYKLVPRLRFPEFENAGEWEMLELSEITDRITEKIETKKITTVSISAGLGFVSQAEKFSRDISGQQYKNYIHLRKDEFAYNKGNSKTFPQGCIYKLIEFDEAAVPNAFICFRFKSKVVADFYQGYFANNFHGKQLKKFITSGARMDGLLNISPSDFFSISFPTPTKREEQQKIASCLSSLDEVITAESQKLELYQQHKKGLLQNLFPQEGETLPKLRFKEFEDSGDWEAKRLGEIATFVNEKTQLENLSINSYISTENLLPDYAGVTLASKLPSSGNFTKYQKGDVLVSNIRPYLKKVWFAENDGGCSNDVIVIRTNSFILDVFLSLLLRNDAFISYIMKSAEGVKMPRGDKDSIKDYPITFPREKTEQQRIASCLSSLDDLINAQRQKIEMLQRHKKGLLQGLFPPINN